MNRKPTQSKETGNQIDWMITLVPLLIIVALCILFFLLSSAFQ